MRPAQLRLLQALVGNRAVTALLDRQAGSEPAVPVAPVPAAPMPAPTVAVAAGPPAGVVQRGLWDRLAGGVRSLAGGVTRFAGGLKDRLLGTLAGWAKRIPGYGLLCVVLGRDVVSGAAVERSPVNLIGALVGLIPGGQAIFENLQRAGAVQRAADWFAAAVDRLGLTWDAIRGLFTRAWDALGAGDLLDPAGAWAKIAGIFGAPLQRLRSFAVAAGGKLLELVFEGTLSLAGGLGAGVMAIIRRAGGVLGTIVRDPIRFAGNLVAAVRGGLGRFATNIAAHLRSGLFAWLTGALRGAVTLPARLDLRGILGFILDLLGLTWAWVRTRLVRLLGEPTVRRLEAAVDWVRAIVTGGLAAIGDRILSFATGLVDTVIGSIRDWVAKSVVGAAITRLIAMFNPAGAIIGAILAVYNTIRFFIERAQQLGALARSVFDSIAAIAGGNLGNAINAVEQAMARALPVVLGFLARLLGLGDLATPVRNAINRVRTLLDRAMDRVISWIAGVARKLVGRRDTARPGAGAADIRTPAQKRAAINDALRQSEVLMDQPRATPQSVAAGLPEIKGKYGLSSLKVVTSGTGSYKVHAEINPSGDTKTKGHTKTWKLAPGGFTANEGTHFTDDDGNLMFNSRGRPIRVHLITRHVTIGRAGVAQRVVAGKEFATGFLSAAIMERAVTDCLDDRATEINEVFNSGERAAEAGTSAKVSRTLPYKCGYGYSLRIRQSQANKPGRYQQRDVVDVEESVLASVTVIVRVSNSEKGEFLVETAYPTPRGG